MTIYELVIRVCVIDSGVELSHPDLNTNNITGTNDLGTGLWYQDSNGHGTHVLGTIAATTNEFGVVGVMPSNNINIHIVKVFDESGWAYSSSLIAALDVCVQNGADVVNMSLGGSSKSRFESRSFENAYKNGVISIAASGNNGSTDYLYPASYDSVISVGAIDEYNNIADFSQSNDQVELVAPGVSVLSTVPPGSALNASLTTAIEKYQANALEGSVKDTVTADLSVCGFGTSTCYAQGAVCLFERGEITFMEKAMLCESSGGVAVIIYNNESGQFRGTLGPVNTK